MSALLDYAPLLARGALVTLALAVLSLTLATLLGGLGAWAKLSDHPGAKALAIGYTTVVRGVPDLVLILLMFFGGQRLINTLAEAGGGEGVDVSPFVSGFVTIGFIFGAYLVETFRGAYLAIPTGQADAARALGMRDIAIFLKVTFPQLVRHALPGYGNVWLVLLKSTAVVSIIGLEDLVGLANKAGKATREPFTFYLLVIAIFLIYTAVSSWLFRRLEARYTQPVRAEAAT